MTAWITLGPAVTTLDIHGPTVTFGRSSAGVRSVRVDGQVLFDTDTPEASPAEWRAVSAALDIIQSADATDLLS